LTGYYRHGNNGGKARSIPAELWLQNRGFGVVAVVLWRKRHGRPILGPGKPFAGAKKSFCKDQIAIIPVVLSMILEPGCLP
jgi:hypothetical protein